MPSQFARGASYQSAAATRAADGTMQPLHPVSSDRKTISPGRCSGCKQQRTEVLSTKKVEMLDAISMQDTAPTQVSPRDVENDHGNERDKGGFKRGFALSCSIYLGTTVEKAGNLCK